MTQRLSLYILCLNLIFITSISGQWTTQKLSSKRYDICSCQVNDKLFFIAGANSASKATKTIDILDLTTNTWSVKQLQTPKSRPECIVINGKIYVGGSANTAFDSSILEVLDENGNSIQTLTKPNVVGGLMVNIDTKLFMTSYANMDVYDTSNNKWTYFKIPISREVSLPRDNYGMVALTNKILLAGGNYYGKEYKEVSVFDIRLNGWSLDSLPSIRYGSLGIAHNNKAYFIGGQDGDFKYYKTIEIYDEATSKWTMDSLSRGSRFDMAVGLHEDKMYVAGGQVFSFGDQFIDLVDVYDFATKKWDKITLPTGRSAMTVIGAGTNIYFAGGTSDDEDATNIVDIFSLVYVSSAEAEKTVKLSIFPNPVAEEFTINLPDDALSEILTYHIYHADGKIQTTGELNSSHKVDTRSLTTGNYFIKVYDTQNNKVYVCPFIKM